jgi:hypothetical protein
MVIEDLTQAHADLEVELARFRQLLSDALAGEPGAMGLLKAEVGAIQTKLEQEIESEAELEVRAEEVLGEGATNEYRLAEYQAHLRSVAEQVHAALSDGELEQVSALYDDFIAKFEAYTRAEWEFLHASSSLLYPGGMSDG